MKKIPWLSMKDSSNVLNKKIKQMISFNLQSVMLSDDLKDGLKPEIANTCSHGNLTNKTAMDCTECNIMEKNNSTEILDYLFTKPIMKYLR
jgi:hypothetical protein